MSNIAIKPRTLTGIKRLANSLKRERNVKHHGALDLAAQAAGFQNFRHAQKSLPVALQCSSKTEVPLYITVYWRDSDGSKGRETLLMRLTSPWLDIVSKAELRRHRALSAFRGDATDHLEARDDIHSQYEARKAVCAAARAMQFIDATRLRPMNKPYPEFSRAVPDLPGRDHTSLWTDPNGQILIVDEPYQSAVGGLRAERKAWATQHGFSAATSRWPGLYYPDSCSMDLFSHVEDGVPLAPLLMVLDNLPRPPVADEWTGVSAPYSPVFLSPDRVVRGKKKSERRDPRAALRPYRDTIGYVPMFSHAQRRPSTRMPIEAHEEIGRLLKSVYDATYSRRGVHNRVDSVRCTLDDWLQREYNDRELPNERFHNVYYGSQGAPASRGLIRIDRQAHLDKIDKVSKILKRHYPDCVPIHSLQRKLELARHSLKAWKVGRNHTRA
jgi:hypothetical protein